VEGDFGRGDPLAIQGPEGRILGQGLSRYTGDEARAIQGRQSAEIEKLLGYPGRAALIHRDDMAL
jgi:glutamate 5-kinase